MPTLSDIRAITLDLDDTLWAIGPVIARAERKLGEWLDANYAGLAESLSQQDIPALRRRVFEEHPDRSHDLTFMRRRMIGLMGRVAGHDVDVDAAFAVFEKARNELELFADVRPALTSLNRRFRLIAVTNGNADLRRIGIDDLFHGVVSARSVGAAKPEARIFAAAVEAGGAGPWQTLHVGDHPLLDVEGARAAGLRAVWINRVDDDWPDDMIEPDAIVRDLHGLERLLALD